MKKTILLFCGLFLAVSSIFAQGTVRGFVYDKDNGEAVMFATVLLEGTSYGAATDMSGFFTFTNVPKGTYNLMSSYVGFVSDTIQIIVRDKGIVNQSIFIKEGSGVDLATINVTGKREEARTEVRISTVTVSPKQIKSLPGTGGEADLAQYLQVLPGVVFTGDQGGQLYIRGGSPIQNKVLIDGMTIYNPFHSIGFFSVFETETIRNVDVLTGGFNAYYGGRISAVVDISTRDGNKKRYGGLVSASPFQTKVLIEGPLKKLSDDGTGSSSSFLFTAKHSYLEETSKAIYAYIDTAGLPYSYTDFYGKLSFNTESGSKFNVFGFNFTDRVNFSGLANLDWGAFGGGATFKLVPNSTKLIIDGRINYSQYDVQLQEADGKPRSSQVGGFSAGLDFSYFGEDNLIKYGFEINGFQTDFKFTNFLGYNIEQNDNTTELAGFVVYKHTIGDKLVIEPSLRLQYYSSLHETSLEPRLGLKYNATDKLRFKLAGGLYSQNLISTVNEQDIVNLFVGFLSGPDEQITDINGEKTHKLQKSFQGVIGAEIDVTDNITLNIEPYYKGFTQLINLNRNKLEPSDPTYVTETGEAYGLDILTKYDRKNIFVWVAYSLGHVQRNDGEQTYPTVFDRRHNLNVLTTYKFGALTRFTKEFEWEASVRWNYGTGFPFTQTQGFFERFLFNDGIYSDFTSGNGDLGIQYDQKRNGGRLPSYHRMDISLKRVFVFSKNSKLEAVASVTNVYNRENIFFFDRVRYERVNQLPIIPSLGMTLTF